MTLISTEHKPVSIDFVLTDNPINNLSRLAVLRRSDDPKAVEFADAISWALEKKLSPGRYKAQKIGNEWIYSRVEQQPSYPSR